MKETSESTKSVYLLWGTMKLKNYLYNRIKDILPKNLLLYKGNRNRNRVTLTLDDGPHSENTEKILEILRRHEIKATFFMNGRAIEQHKDIVAKVIRDGHEIGNHFYNHRAVTTLSYVELDEEVRKWGKSIDKTLGWNSYSLLIRPPYGRLNLKTIWYAWRNGWTIVFWSIDMRDLDNVPLSDMTKALECKPINGGEIILLHEDSKYIEELLEWIIQEAMKRGLMFCKVSELIPGG